MKLCLFFVTCVATLVVAGPLKYSTGPTLERRQTFTDPTCKLSKAATFETPLSFLFPLAKILGSIVGPGVKAAIGAENEERIDKLGDTLCVSAGPERSILHVLTCLHSNSQQEPSGHLPRAYPSCS
jgi:hypothetical protein